jgi:hypothetical protein
MIKIHHFNEVCQFCSQQKISFRLLQDQALVMISLCQNPHSSISNPLDITQADIDWLMQQPEAMQDYSDYLGGYVYVCETENDLLQIHGCDLQWAEVHDGNWPNVTDVPVSWDACNYLDEVSGEPQWVIFLLCWNNAGGPVYYVPKHLWVLARVADHIESTNHNLKT